MNRMFSHWLYWRPLAQALLDSAFIVVGALIALGWASSGLPINQKQVALFGLIYVTVAMLITALLGINQRINEPLTSRATRASPTVTLRRSNRLVTILLGEAI